MRTGTMMLILSFFAGLSTAQAQDYTMQMASTPPQPTVSTQEPAQTTQTAQIPSGSVMAADYGPVSQATTEAAAATTSPQSAPGSVDYGPVFQAGAADMATESGLFPDGIVRDASMDAVFLDEEAYLNQTDSEPQYTGTTTEASYMMAPAKTVEQLNAEIAAAEAALAAFDANVIPPAQAKVNEANQAMNEARTKEEQTKAAAQGIWTQMQAHLAEYRSLQFQLQAVNLEIAKMESPAYFGDRSGLPALYAKRENLKADIINKDAAGEQLVAQYKEAEAVHKEAVTARRDALSVLVKARSELNALKHQRYLLRVKIDSLRAQLARIAP